MVNQPFFHGDIPNFRCLSPNMCHGQNLCVFFVRDFFFGRSPIHHQITSISRDWTMAHMKIPIVVPGGVSINVGTPKCLVFISWKIPSRNGCWQGYPYFGKLHIFDHPTSLFYMHARFVPVISGYYMVIIWLLSGYYMVIIWFLYGYYMVYDNNNLVGGAMCPSWKMELKSMGRMTSHIIIMEHKSHVWNHQPVLYEGGRVIYFPCWSNPIISDLQDLPTPLVAKWDDPPSNQLS